jgi:hypothetical protein
MKDAYKKKAEAELEIAQAKVAEFKARSKNISADNRIKYEKHLDELKHAVDASKARMKELGNAGEDNWEKLKEGFEKAFNELKEGIRKMTEKFKD